VICGVAGGVAGVMVSSDARVSHGFLGLNQGFDNTITSSDSRATNENSLVPRCEDGIMDDDEYISSSMKQLETLQAVKDDARVVLNLEEQLHILDHAINSFPVLSNLKIDKPSVVSATAPIFSHAKSCINVSKESQGLNNEKVKYDVDSLEAIRVEEFNVGRNSTPKEKKSTRGRPRKYP